MSDAGVETYDHVVLATHSDQALRLLSDPDRMERETLGALRYQPNRATLHTDASLLPTERRAWASWNYHRLEADRDEATLTYYLNRLQGIDSATPVLVTLNRDDAIDPEKVLARMEYAHPVLDSGGGAGPRWPRRDQRHPAYLVRGRVLGLWLPRGRRAQRGGDVPGPGRDVVTVAAVCRPPAPVTVWRRPTCRVPGRDNVAATPAAPGPTGTSNGLRSSMYEGVLAHARFGPGPTHSFSYKVAMPLLDLAEVEAVMGLHPAWSAHRAAPVRFRRRGLPG